MMVKNMKKKDKNCVKLDLSSKHTYIKSKIEMIKERQTIRSPLLIRQG